MRSSRFHFLNKARLILATSFMALSAQAGLSPQQEIIRSHQIETATMPNSDGVTILSADDEVKSFNVVERSYFRAFEDVIKRLHTRVENETDVIYLVNTLNENNTCSPNVQNLQIPKQHMVMLKRKSAGQSLFIRNEQNEITGLNPDGVEVVVLGHKKGVIDASVTPVPKALSTIQPESETSFIPVSTGVSGNGRILTYSGIFRMNERRTNDMRKSTNTTSDPMQNSVYINGEYYNKSSNSSSEARLAFHGTSKSQWPYLGVRRASSGCIRLQSDFSKWNQNFLFSKQADGQLVPRAEFTGSVKLWSRVDQYPEQESSFTSLMSGQKLRALAVFFDGYKGKCL